MTKLLRDDMMNLEVEYGKKYYNSQKEITEKKEYKNTAFRRSSFFYIYSNLFRTIDKDKTERSEQYAFRSGKADAY